MIPFNTLDKLFPQGPKTIIEIGAADGKDTVVYATHYPSALVFAYEPLRRNYVALTEATQNLTNVLPVQMALGDQDADDVTFWESGGAPPQGHNGPWPYSSSLLPPKEHQAVHPWCTFAPTVVNVRRFDSRMAATALHTPICVHIDVQGAELKVLKGFGKRLDDVAAIWMEVSNVELYEGQPLRNDVAEFMSRKGFSLYLDALGSALSGDQLWWRAP